MSRSMHRLAILSMVLGTACFSTHVYAAEPVPEDTHNASSTSTESSTYEATLGETVVTGYRTRRPLTLSTNPQRPRQPIPASDGAGYLKAIPGFSVVRKGGVGGDPMLRGMGGSRIVMNMNGDMMSGGCPNRMDPTSTYAFPETFSRIIVNKGPQSVRYGASVAGNVVFERRTKRFERAGGRGNVSILGSSTSRRAIRKATPALSRRGTIHVTTPTARGAASTRVTAAIVSQASSVSPQTPTPYSRSPTTAVVAGQSTHTA